jgi:hypothetical protein
MADKKRCLVVMGFGIKTDLDEYLAVIGPALEQCGHLLSPAWQRDGA